MIELWRRLKFNDRRCAELFLYMCDSLGVYVCIMVLVDGLYMRIRYIVEFVPVSPYVVVCIHIDVSNTTFNMLFLSTIHHRMAFCKCICFYIYIFFSFCIYAVAPLNVAIN